ncbi:MAG: ATP-binding protein [Deferrisomatales bacterium]
MVESALSCSPRAPGPEALAARLARWAAGRPDTEHEQALLRLVLGAVGSAFVAGRALQAGPEGARTALTLGLVLAFGVAAVALFALVLLFPGPAPARRVAGMVLDNAATSIALCLDGGLAVPLFALYLWVAFGNGFRYGIPYLAASAALGLLGFAAAAAEQGLWQAHPGTASGILIGLVVLPAYVAALLRKLREALSRAQAASEAKGRFVANMSHEIRTPLHGVIGLNELLLGTALDPRQRRFAELVHRCAGWLLSVLNDVLDVAKIEARQLRLEQVPFDPRQAVADVAEFHAEACRARGLILTCRLAPELPPAVSGDPLRLAQVLNNLLANAVRFTSEGSVAVRAWLVSETPEGQVLGFEVSDTGPGVPAEAREKIFEAFAQADDSTARRHGGTGLGLSIARHLVEMMGGALVLESEPGRGATFRFEARFGRCPVEEVPAAAHPGAPAPAAQWPRPPRVLAAEDNPVSRELLSHLLQGFGCHATLAADGQEAVAAVGRGEFDVILMDCQMPGTDGYQAARAIRAMGSRVPIVALTAHAAAQDRDRCLAAGMDDYLRKPFRGAELWAALVRWVPGAGVLPAVGDRPGQVPVPAPPPPGEAEAERRRALHDVNNYLWAAQGFVELAAEELPAGTGARQRLDKAQAALKRAGERVAQELGHPARAG